ncbi:DUF1858 domain-containing protein [Halosquirtibacter xylanolyticus]|uniref:DUF1858 domain-containing protein n=1 Tax=Halosquirtibacter xylanolyticus TaxID=3374599 RepID=UPI00374A6E98|nr:DUF1858 domain-containing protein [Prolixibacteraceae bacterium]
MMHSLIITPKTKISDLLEAYPQLEEVLIGIAPAFKKLKNPILRKVVAKVTTLSQAAVIGDIKVEELVLLLRKEVGQEGVGMMEVEENRFQTTRPDWHDTSSIVETLDIREKLNEGEQPMHDILSSIKRLKSNEMLKVIAPFIPAPIIDKTLSLQYEHWLVEKGHQEYWVFFKKQLPK